MSKEYAIIKHKEKGFVNLSGDKIRFSDKEDLATRFIDSLSAVGVLSSAIENNKKYKVQDFLVSTINFKEK